VGIKISRFSTNKSLGYISQTIQDIAIVTFEGEWNRAQAFEWHQFLTPRSVRDSEVFVVSRVSLNMLTISTTTGRALSPGLNNKLSCRRETAQRFMSLNILLSQSRQNTGMWRTDRRTDGETFCHSITHSITRYAHGAWIAVSENRH